MPNYSTFSNGSGPGSDAETMARYVSLPPYVRLESQLFG